MDILGQAFFIIAVLSFLRFLREIFYWVQAPLGSAVRQSYEMSMGLFLGLFVAFSIFSWALRTGLN